MTINYEPQRRVELKPLIAPGLNLDSEVPELSELDDNDWYTVLEDPIDSGFKYFSEAAEQLHAKIDSLEIIYRSLSAIVNYEKSNYTLLYATKEGIDYYMPRMPCGSYSTGNDVIDFIRKKIRLLTDTYTKKPMEERWKVLKISRQLLPGMEKIIEDYSSSSTYQPFKENIYKLKTELESFILDRSIVMNRAISLFILKNREYDLYDLLNLCADSYPRYLVYDCIEKCYGKRLAGEVLPKYIENSENSRARIYYDELYGLLFAIATNLRSEDLEWKYQQLKCPRVQPLPSSLIQGLGLVDTDKRKKVLKTIDYLDPATASGFVNTQPVKSFTELSPLDINRLVAYFRRAPNGLNLLDYFGIPISLDKSNVISTFLNTSSASIEQENRINEIYFYADIESTKIWHCDGIIQMSRVQMYDQLSRLFENPREGQLFHTDRYISFLNVAATSIAYLKSCSSPEEVSAKMTPLLDLLNGIVENAHVMYPVKYVEVYKTCWLTLIGKLKDGMKNPEYNFNPYYLNFFTHPLQSSEEQKEVLRCHREFQQREFLSRKAAYWHRHELNSTHYIEASGHFKLPDLSHREGTLFHLNVGNKMELFRVERIILRDGFVCQLCLPYQIKEYAKQNKPLPIKIVFQGTISNPLSIERDKNIAGPGDDLWRSETTTLVIPELKEVMEGVRGKFPTMTFIFDSIGHSLGGADAQNFLSYMGQACLIRDLQEDWIAEINLYTFNAAGVPVDTVKRFNNNFKENSFLIGALMHSLVKNDIVSRGGEAMVGYQLPFTGKLRVIEISNSGVFHVLVNHCDFNHSWTDTILPRKILDPQGDALTYLKRSAHSWRDFSNHAKDLISESPFAQVATGCAYIAFAVFFNYQLTLMAEGLMFMGGALLSTGVRIVHLEGDIYTRGQIRDTINDVWKAASHHWVDNQVLENED